MWNPIEYLQGFEEMVLALKKHPDLVLLNYHRGEPATPYQIEQLQENFPMLSKDMIAFYEVCNGLQLRWIHKKNSQYEDDYHTEMQAPEDFFYALQNYQPEDGIIMILPIEQLNTDWDGRIYFDHSDNYKKDFIFHQYGGLYFDQHIKPFDAFSMYNDMALFTGFDSVNFSEKFTKTQYETYLSTYLCPIIMGDDHQACYTDSLITDFASYMEFLLYCKGIRQARAAFYSKYEGHTKTPLITPKAYFEAMPQVDLRHYDTVNNCIVLPFEKKFYD